MYSLFDFVYYLLPVAAAAGRDIGMAAGMALLRRVRSHESGETDGTRPSSILSALYVTNRINKANEANKTMRPI